MSVRINIGHLNGKQPEFLAHEMIDSFVISQTDVIFVPIATFLLSFLGFSALAETYRDRNPKPWAPEDCIALDASAAGLRLYVLGSPIAQAAIDNHWPDQITINLAEQPIPYDGISYLGNIHPYLFSAMQGMFTDFYEEHVKTIKSIHGANACWPAVWNFGRVIRNALSHGGELDIRRPTSVSWHSLRFTEIDHGKRVILADLWPGDLFLLLRDMEQALPVAP